MQLQMTPAHVLSGPKDQRNKPSVHPLKSQPNYLKNVLLFIEPCIFYLCILKQKSMQKLKHEYISFSVMSFPGYCLWKWKEKLLGYTQFLPP